MKTTTNFKTWLSSYNENEVPVSTQSAQVSNVSEPRGSVSDMSTDVDAIINSLETLANELTEEIANINLDEIHEGAASATVDFMFRAPKARKAQKKVNSMELKVAGLEAAASAMKGDKKSKVVDKVKMLKAQSVDLQKAVDDKFGSSSDIVKRALSSEKIKGKLEVIKTAMGDKNNDAGDLKSQAKKLQQRLKDEEDALAEAEPDKSEVEKLKKEKEDEGKEKDTKSDKDKEETPEEKEARLAKEKEDEETPEEKEARLAKEKEDEETPEEKEARLAKEKEDEETPEEKEARLAKEKEALKDKDNADDDTKKDRETKNSKDGMIDRYKDLLKKAQDSGDEDNIKKFQDKIDSISQKESWQIEGTELGRILESELSTYEMTITLNESRYENLSIKDKFSRLL